MERLKKILRLSGEEFSDSLRLSHSEFVSQLRQKTIDYKLPKRYINIFYRLYIDKWRQIIMQILLILLWGAVIFSVYLFIKSEWRWGLVAIIVTWTIKKYINAFALWSINKGLVTDEKFYDDLLYNGIIGIYPK